ncbi:MAG: MerR family transcriptional regulator [Bacteroidota bacterium]|nr:MerR family transcriptional regulator [Bacteroidota bacterium]
MGEYTIKDLEKLSGIKAHTMRIWEKRYDIVNPDRTDTNRRRYNDDDLRKLIKISRIASMAFSEIEEKVSFILQDIKQDDSQIESLMIAMVNLDETAFNNLINRSILNRGFENTFTSIFFPFLDRVGVLWVTGSISPAQEHFVSNLVRQKIISNIDAQISKKRENKKRVIFFLPENEFHELGLLFYAYIARKDGHEVLYLGSHTPLDSVKESIKIWPPDILVTGTLSNFSRIYGRDYLEKLASEFPEQLIIVSGTLALNLPDNLPHNIVNARNSDDFIRLVNE